MPWTMLMEKKSKLTETTIRNVQYNESWNKKNNEKLVNMNNSPDWNMFSPNGPNACVGWCLPYETAKHL